MGQLIRKVYDTILIEIKPKIQSPLVDTSKILYIYKEADISLELSTKTLIRYQVIDQTFPLMTDNVAIMIPYPEKGNCFSLTMSTSTIIVNNKMNAYLFVFYYSKNISPPSRL